MIELLSNFDIIDICKSLDINIIQCESKINIRIPPTKNRLCCYVVNLDNTSGSHWCTLVVYNNNGFYFDSFGIVPPLEIKQFCKINRISLEYNNNQIQDLLSTACGWYCIAFMYFIKTNLRRGSNGFEKLNSKFCCKFNTEIQDDNDRVLQSLIKTFVK